MIALLRGINVSGRNKILMAELRTLFVEMGFSDVSTYIQSGNIVFKAEDSVSLSEIENSIQQGILQQFGFEVPVIIKSDEYWEKLMALNPFSEESSDNPEKLYVTFLKESAKTKYLEELQKFDFQPDKFIVIEKTVFVFYATNYSDSKLNNTLLENKLKVQATTRNWKTVLKLFEMVNN